MSAFADKSFQSHEYALHRPSYSLVFFKYIFKFAELTTIERSDLSIVDIGTGPGTCIITIIPYIIELLKNGLLKVKKVKLYITDVSITMIKEAERNIINKLSEYSSDIINLFGVHYSVIGGEQLLDIIDPSSIDIVLAAECVHWTDDAKLLKCINTILKPIIGVFAYWGYVDPVFVDREFKYKSELIQKANKFYSDFVYEEEGKLGSYWQQPGRKILRGLCRGINDKVFEDTVSWRDVVTVYRDPLAGKVDVLDRLIDKDVKFKINDEALKMIQKTTVNQYLQYVDTWSSSHKWNSSHSEDQRVSKLFFKGLHEQTGWELDDEIEVEMKTFYTLTKKS